MNKTNLTEGSILKTLFVFAIPFLLANILQSLYGAVDLFVVGQYCDARSVAAVSTGTQVTQIITSLVSGLTLGSTIIIGKYMGEKRYDPGAPGNRHDPYGVFLCGTCPYGNHDRSGASDLIAS